MKILIKIDATTELLCHEALSLALALASFDHQIQLELGTGILTLLLGAPTGKLAKMLGSLPLYDIDPAWLASTDMVKFHRWQSTRSSACDDIRDWEQQLQARPILDNPVESHFDAVISL